MASSVKVASALSAPLIIPLLLFGGFFLNNGSVPIYFQWLRHISWFMYGNEALSINQWRGVSFNETLCAGNTTLLGQICSGEDVLAQLNFSLVTIVESGRKTIMYSCQESNCSLFKPR